MKVITLPTSAGAVFLALVAFFANAQTSVKSDTAVWWTPDLRLASLSDVPAALSAPVLRDGKPAQATLTRGSAQRSVHTCTEYLRAISQKFATFDDKGSDTPFVERCYPLAYLRSARPPVKSYVGGNWTPEALDQLPPFDLFVEASLSSKADRARARGESWKKYDPTMRVVSASGHTLILENATVRWSLVLDALADVNADGLNDAVVIACDSKKTTGGGLCFPMVLTAARSGERYRLLSASSPPYRLLR